MSRTDDVAKLEAVHALPSLPAEIKAAIEANDVFAVRAIEAAAGEPDAEPVAGLRTEIEAVEAFQKRSSKEQAATIRDFIARIGPGRDDLRAVGDLIDASTLSDRLRQDLREQADDQWTRAQKAGAAVSYIDPADEERRTRRMRSRRPRSGSASRWTRTEVLLRPGESREPALI